MKIKIIQSINESKVEKKVNQFIENTQVKIIDMQYSATPFHFSVMIKYEER